MRILVTGAGGQLGHDLVDVFSAEDVYPFDHHALDIADQQAVEASVARVRPDWIVNAAAYNSVDAAEDNRELAFAVNAAGAGYLAQAARQGGASILHISTDYVFDGRKGSAYVEDDQPNPLSVYGNSKHAGERRVMDSGAPACVIRTAWLYGRHGSNFVKAMLTAAGKGGPLKVVRDQVGSPTSTADLAQAIHEIVRRPARGLFHVANAGACSRFDFAEAILRGRVKVTPITTVEAQRRAPRPANSSLASVRWESAGFKPLRPWREALEDFLSAESPGREDGPNIGYSAGANRG
jgi:dTDP-4-dehydrorhamnose reductase